MALSKQARSRLIKHASALVRHTRTKVAADDFTTRLRNYAINNPEVVGQLLGIGLGGLGGAGLGGLLGNTGMGAGLGAVGGGLLAHLFRGKLTKLRNDFVAQEAFKKMSPQLEEARFYRPGGAAMLGVMGAGAGAGLGHAASKVMGRQGGSRLAQLVRGVGTLGGAYLGGTQGAEYGEQLTNRYIRGALDTEMGKQLDMLKSKDLSGLQPGVVEAFRRARQQFSS